MKYKPYKLEKGCFTGRFNRCSDCQNTNQCWEYYKEFGVFQGINRQHLVSGFATIEHLGNTTVQAYNEEG